MGVGVRLLVVGGTGAVGQRVLRLALDDPRVAHVVAPTRRRLGRRPRLENPVIDFSGMPADAPWWQVDSVVCALGTTIGAAGSQAAFAAVDRDLPIAVGRLARNAGARCYALNSSLGASPAGNFYLHTKAEAEAGIRALGFPSFTIVRPSLIDVDRAESRPVERIGLTVAKLLRPLIPKRYRAVSADRIALALFESAVVCAPGEHIVESEDLHV